MSIVTDSLWWLLSLERSGGRKKEREDVSTELSEKRHYSRLIVALTVKKEDVSTDFECYAHRHETFDVFSSI